jgi:hypothetical protein
VLLPAPDRPVNQRVKPVVSFCTRNRSFLSSCPDEVVAA